MILFNSIMCDETFGSDFISFSLKKEERGKNVASPQHLKHRYKREFSSSPKQRIRTRPHHEQHDQISYS